MKKENTKISEKEFKNIYARFLQAVAENDEDVDTVLAELMFAYLDASIYTMCEHPSLQERTDMIAAANYFKTEVIKRRGDVQVSVEQ